MKKLCLCLILLILTGCTKHNVGVVSNKRILLSGSVLNAENNPREGISIKSSGSERFILHATPRELLGETATNTSGEFSIVSLDTDNSFFGLSINHPNAENYRENLASIHYIDSIGTRTVAYELGDIYLPEVQEYEIKVKNSSGSTDTLFFQFQYNNPEQYRFFDKDAFVDYYGIKNELQARNRLIPMEGTLSTTFKTLEDTEIDFLYKYTAETTYDTTSVTLSPENPIYEFSY
jgi:hypothetical protein